MNSSVAATAERVIAGRAATKQSRQADRRLLRSALNDGRHAMEDALGLPDGAFRRIDEDDDELFYEPARLVHHIDDHAVAALTRFYREMLPAGGALLDLMSSWVSHLPPRSAYAEVFGHGMKPAEP